jgi:uncharacterized protein (DUF488 family)
MKSKIQVWSVGHSVLPTPKFIDVLSSSGIELVVDVRSNPYSKYTPHFNQRHLAESLAAFCIDYVFKGDSLGGRPPESFMYDDEGYVLYSELSMSARFLQGLKELVDLASQRRTAMMCSEESPVDCHRRLLISRVLTDDIEVIHLRADGSEISERDLSSNLNSHLQPTLFDTEEVRPWKSIRPVLRSTAREASSDF